MSDAPHRLASPSRIDRAIDRAVRGIMQIDPRPGFRRRVLDRLDPEPIRSSMFFRIALVAGTVALVVLAAMIVVPTRRSPLPAGISSSTTPQTQSGPQRAGPHQLAHEAASAPPQQAAPLERRPTPRRALRPTVMPRVANLFGDRNSAVAAASVAAETVWPAPPPEEHEERDEGLTPLAIPSVQPPAPIVIPPINARGPGLDH